ncbi:putative membrane attachment protein [Neospora caninum Liverpool]|uniref:Membrane attachment protein, putative n=1 Tax=Neospora caninum (strain Liverpool) TaxID=572307 RepID=F0VPM5_NEOCL|nr:putative membrane attachment protein [Neospora caninum Liverpool]CBZ55672.1 putative membrane attachment protein [Neospora caninum Liverpool]CEL70414.1 TPA: membrane attachment protein, putative [Neospora caninum Liverpool]|eukprot:XP_003885698.1 putative membrane attachment protein [Neospora caninum Liverpool]
MKSSRNRPDEEAVEFVAVALPSLRHRENLDSLSFDLQPELGPTKKADATPAAPADDLTGFGKIFDLAETSPPEAEAVLSLQEEAVLPADEESFIEGLNRQIGNAPQEQKREKKEVANPLAFVTGVDTYKKDIPKIGAAFEEPVRLKRARILIDQGRAAGLVVERMVSVLERGTTRIDKLMKNAQRLPDGDVTQKFEALSLLTTHVNGRQQLLEGQAKARSRLKTLLSELSVELKWIELNAAQTNETRQLEEEGRRLSERIASKRQKLDRAELALKKTMNNATSLVDAALAAIASGALARAEKGLEKGQKVEEHRNQLVQVFRKAGETAHTCKQLQKSGPKSKGDSAPHSALGRAIRAQALLERLMKNGSSARKSLEAAMVALNDVSDVATTVSGIIEMEPLASSPAEPVKEKITAARDRAHSVVDLHDILTNALVQDARLAFRALRHAYLACDAATAGFWVALKRALQARMLRHETVKKLRNVLERKLAMAKKQIALMKDMGTVSELSLKTVPALAATGLTEAVAELNRAGARLKALDLAMARAYAVQVGFVALPNFRNQMAAAQRHIRRRFWSAPHRQLADLIASGMDTAKAGAAMVPSLAAQFRNLNAQRVTSLSDSRAALVKVQAGVLAASRNADRVTDFVADYTRSRPELAEADAIFRAALVDVKEPPSATKKDKTSRERKKAKATEAEVTYEQRYVAMVFALQAFAVLRESFAVANLSEFSDRQRLLKVHLDEVRKVLRTGVNKWTPAVVTSKLKNVRNNLRRVTRRAAVVANVYHQLMTQMQMRAKTLATVLHDFYITTGNVFREDLGSAKRLLVAAVAGRRDLVSTVEKYKNACGVLKRLTDPQATPLKFEAAERLLEVVLKLDSLVDRLWEAFSVAHVSLQDTLATMKRREALMPRAIKGVSARSRTDIEKASQSVWRSAREAYDVLLKAQAVVATWREAATEMLRRSIAKKLTEIQDQARQILSGATRQTQAARRLNRIAVRSRTVDFSALDADARATWKADLGSLNEAEASLPVQAQWQQTAAKYISDMGLWMRGRRWDFYGKGADLDYRTALHLNKAAENALQELRTALKTLDASLHVARGEMGAMRMALLMAEENSLAAELAARAETMARVARSTKKALKSALEKAKIPKPNDRMERHLSRIQARVKRALKKYDAAVKQVPTPEQLWDEMTKSEDEAQRLAAKHPDLAEDASGLTQILEEGRSSMESLRKSQQSAEGEVEALRRLEISVQTDVRLLELKRLLLAGETRVREAAASASALNKRERAVLSEVFDAQGADPCDPDCTGVSALLARSRELLQEATDQRAVWKEDLNATNRELALDEKWTPPQEDTLSEAMNRVALAVAQLRNTTATHTAELKEQLASEEATHTALQTAVQALENRVARVRLTARREHVDEVARKAAIVRKAIGDVSGTVAGLRGRLLAIQNVLEHRQSRRGLSDEAIVAKAKTMDANFDRVSEDLDHAHADAWTELNTVHGPELKTLLEALESREFMDKSLAAEADALAKRLADDQAALVAAQKSIAELDALFAAVSRLDSQRRSQDQVYVIRLRLESLEKETAALVDRHKAMERRLTEQAARGAELPDGLAEAAAVSADPNGVAQFGDDPVAALVHIEDWLMQSEGLLSQVKALDEDASQHIQSVTDSQREIKEQMANAYLHSSPEDLVGLGHESEAHQERLQKMLKEVKDAQASTTQASASLDEQARGVSARIVSLRAAAAQAEILGKTAEQRQLNSVVADLLTRHASLATQLTHFRSFLEGHEAFVLQRSSRLAGLLSRNDVEEIDRRRALVADGAAKLRSVWEAHARERSAFEQVQRELQLAQFPKEKLQEYRKYPRLTAALDELQARSKGNVHLVEEGAKAIQVMSAEFADIDKRARYVAEVALTARLFYTLTADQTAAKERIKKVTEAATEMHQHAARLISELSAALSRAERLAAAGSPFEVGPGTRETLGAARQSLEAKPASQWTRELANVATHLQQLDEQLRNLQAPMSESGVFSDDLATVRATQAALHKDLERSQAVVTAAERKQYDLHLATTAASDFFYGVTLSTARDQVLKLAAEEDARHVEIDRLRSQIVGLLRDLKAVATAAWAPAGVDWEDASSVLAVRAQEVADRQRKLADLAREVSRQKGLAGERAEATRRLLGRWGEQPGLEQSAAALRNAVAQSEGQLKECEDLLTEAGLHLSTVDRVKRELEVMVELARAHERQRGLQKEMQRVSAVLEHSLGTAQSVHASLKRSLLSPLTDEAETEDVPDFATANAVVAATKQVEKDTTSSLVGMAKEIAKLDRDLATLSTKTQAESGSLRTRVQTVQDNQAELRGAISQLRGSLESLAQAGRNLEEVTRDFAGHVRRQELALAQNQIAAKIEEQRALAAEVARDGVEVDRLRQDVDKLLASLRQLTGDSSGADPLERFGFRPRALHPLGDDHVEKAEELAAHLSEAAARVRSAQAELAHAESSWKRFGRLREPMKVLRELTEKSAQAVNTLGIKLANILADLAGVEKLAESSDFSALVVDVHDAVGKLAVEAERIIQEAKAVQGAAASAAKACRTEMVTVMMLRSSEADDAILAERAAAYQAAVSVLEDGTVKTRKWGQTITQIKGSSRAMSETVRILKQVEPKRQIRDGLRTIVGRLELLAPVIDRAEAEVDAAEKILQALVEDASALRMHVKSVAGEAERTLKALVSRVDAWQTEVETMASQAAALRKESKAGMRTLLAAAREDSPIEFAADLDATVAGLEDAARSAKAWLDRTRQVQGEISAVTRDLEQFQSELLDEGRESIRGRALTTSAETAAALARLAADLEDFVSDIESVKPLANRGSGRSRKQAASQDQAHDRQIAKEVQAVETRVEETAGVMRRLSESFAAKKPSADFATAAELWEAREALRPIELETRGALDRLENLLASAKTTKQEIETTLASTQQAQRGSADGQQADEGLVEQLQALGERLDEAIRRGGDSAASVALWLRQDGMVAADEENLRRLFADTENVRDMLVRAEHAIDSYAEESSQQRAVVSDATELTSRFQRNTAALADLDAATCQCSSGLCPLNELGSAVASVETVATEAKTAVANLAAAVQAARYVAQESVKAPAYLRVYVARAQDLVHWADARLKELQSDCSVLDEDFELLKAEAENLTQTVRDLFRRRLSQKLAVVAGVAEQLEEKKLSLEQTARGVQALQEQLMRLDKTAEAGQKVEAAEQTLAAAEARLREADDEARDMRKLQQGAPEKRPATCVSTCFLAEAAEAWQGNVAKSHAQAASLVEAAARLVVEIEADVEAIRGLRDSVVSSSAAGDPRFAPGREFLDNLQTAKDHFAGLLDRAEVLVEAVESRQSALPVPGDLVEGLASSVAVDALAKISQDLGEAARLTARCRQTVPALRRYERLARANLEDALEVSEGPQAAATRAAVEKVAKQVGKETARMHSVAAAVERAEDRLLKYSRNAVSHSVDLLVRAANRNDAQAKELAVAFRGLADLHAAAMNLQTARFHTPRHAKVPAHEAAERVEAAQATLAEQAEVAKQIVAGSAFVRGGAGAIRAAEMLLEHALLTPAQTEDLGVVREDGAEAMATEHLRRARGLVRQMASVARLLKVGGKPSAYLAFPLQRLATRARLGRHARDGRQRDGEAATQSPIQLRNSAAASVARVAEHRRQAQVSLAFVKERLDRLKAARQSLEQASERQREVALKLESLQRAAGDDEGESGVASAQPRRLAASPRPSVRRASGEASMGKSEMSRLSNRRRRTAAILAAQNDLRRAQKALADVTKTAEAMSSSQEEVEKHLRELNAMSKAVEAVAREGPVGSDVAEMQLEIEEMVEEGRRLFGEYAAQLKEMNSERSKLEAEFAVQSAATERLVGDVAPSEEELLVIMVEQARSVLAQMHEGHEEAARLVSDIRSLPMRGFGSDAVARKQEARRLSGMVGTLAQVAQESSEVALEAIEVLESLGDDAAPARAGQPRDGSEISEISQQAAEEAAALRKQLHTLQDAFRARQREAEEGIIETPRDASLLLSLSSTLVHIGRTTSHVAAKVKALRASRVELAALSRALEEAAKKDSTPEEASAASWTEIVEALAGLQSRVKKADEKATALGGSAQALANAASEDLGNAQTVLSGCTKNLDEVLVARCQELETAVKTASEQALPDLRASISETGALQAVVLDKQHVLLTTVTAKAKNALQTNMAQAEEISVRSNGFLSDLRKTADELRALVAAAKEGNATAGISQPLGRGESQLQSEPGKEPGGQTVVDKELVSTAKQIAGHGAALAKSLSIGATAMRATLMPRSVGEALHEASLVAGIEQHERSVQAQTQRWEQEVTQVVAEMQDAVAELQRAYRPTDPTYVRHEVVANLAVVSALLRSGDGAQESTVDSIPQLFKAAILLSRAKALLRSVSEPGENQAPPVDNSDLEAKAEELGRRLQDYMQQYNLGQFDAFVSSTGSGAWAAEDLGLAPRVEAALAALGRMQAEAAKLMRARSNAQDVDAEEDARLQAQLKERLHHVSAETRRALGMLQSTLLNGVQRNDAKIQRLVATLAQGADLASRLTRETTATASGSGQASWDRGAGNGDEENSEAPSEDPEATLAQMALLLERVQEEAAGSETHDESLPAAESKDPETLATFQKITQDIQSRNAAVSQSLNAASASKSEEAPAEYVERLSQVMEQADQNRKNLEVGLAVGLGIVLFLIVVVAVALVLVKRRLRRRLAVLTRSEATGCRSNN